MSTNKSSLFETAMFKVRPIIVLVFLLLTVFFAYQAKQVSLTTDFFKMIPLKHEFIQNMLRNIEDLPSSNSIRIAIETNEEDIFNEGFLQTLKEVTDEIFYFPGVDKGNIKSLWTPNVRWSEVTEEGFRGGEMIPPEYDGSASSLDEVRANVLKSTIVGSLVADNFKSAIIDVPILDQADGFDVKQFSDDLESKIRDKYQSENTQIHIVGFVKKVGDLINGATGVGMFFLIAIVITFVLLLIDSKCLRSTTVVIVCSVFAVIWQVGILTLLNKPIDPYSMLVPFLIFAIGVSHGVQLINEFAVESYRVDYKLEAARLTFRALCIPALLALVSDAIGFMTLWTIEIHVIQDLAMSAALGVASLIFTNLVMIPIFLSFVGASKRAVDAMNKKMHHKSVLWDKISYCASPKVAGISLVIACLLGALGMYISKDIKTGDLDVGAPELWPDSRYNLDDKYINENYSVSADVMVVMVETPKDACVEPDALQKIDRFMWHMENVPGVQSTASVATFMKFYIMAQNEGNMKWQTILRVKEVLNAASQFGTALFNLDCDLAPVAIYLNDHKAETLEQVVAGVKEFAARENDPKVAQFILATGNAGIEAATNDTINQAQMKMQLLVYGVVSLLCLLSFRSVPAVICIILPLVLTSILCQALMTMLGIGIKVATLPVIALGVGIGVDYGIYIFTRLKGFMEDGMELQQAYYETLRVTGKAVCFTGLTLAIGVGTWIFSDIKFQANMGVLLTFMFVWNMIGAIWLLPALAHFLLRGKVKVKTAEA